MRLLLITLSVLLLSFTTMAQEQTSEPEKPVWELKKQDGTLVKSTDYEGTSLILHFWGTWCPHCKRLQPALDKIARDYDGKGIEVLGVSVHESDDADPQAELEERGYILQTVVNGEEVATDLFGVFGTPTTVFIGPDGTVLGATMEANPDDPQWEKVAQYLASAATQ